MTEEEAKAIRARITEPEAEGTAAMRNPLSPEQRADRTADKGGERRWERGPAYRAEVIASYDGDRHANMEAGS